jgi:hypothetical protein
VHELTGEALAELLLGVHALMSAHQCQDTSVQSIVGARDDTRRSSS